MSKVKLLRYYLLVPDSDEDATKALQEEAKVIDGEITVSGVRTMTRRVLHRHRSHRWQDQVDCLLQPRLASGVWLSRFPY